MRLCSMLQSKLDLGFCFFGCFKCLSILQHNIRKCNKRKLNEHEEFWSCSLPSLSLQFLELQGNVPSLNTSSNYLAEMLCIYKSPKCTSVNRSSLEKEKRSINPPSSHTDWKTQKNISIKFRTNSSHSCLSRLRVEHCLCSTPAFIITTKYDWNIRLGSSVIRR